jgi:DeoR/GlpR family transcriptional regulator of sugar metabolism
MHKFYFVKAQFSAFFAYFYIFFPFLDPIRVTDNHPATASYHSKLIFHHSVTFFLASHSTLDPYYFCKIGHFEKVSREV